MVELSAVEPDLDVEKAAAIFGTGQLAAFVATENAVAGTSDEIIRPVAKPLRQPADENACWTPDSAQARQDEYDRIGTWTQRFVRLVVVHHHVDRVEVTSGGAVAGQNTFSEGALQRGKAKQSFRIVAQDELVRAIAEPADTVVKQERVRKRLCLSHHRFDPSPRSSARRRGCCWVRRR